MQVKKETIIRLIVLIIVLFNQILVSCGHSPLPFDDATINEMVSTIITIVVAFWAWWKNNSFTKEAIEADKIMLEMKKNKE